MAKAEAKAEANGTTVRIPTPADLRALRARLGLTQAEAAAKVGVARRTWMYWETESRGRRPSYPLAILIGMLSDGRLGKLAGAPCN